MTICEVCEKELVGDEQPMHLYVAKVQSRAVKGGVTNSTIIEYKDFKAVDVPVCSRHKRLVTVQRVNSGTIAVVVLFFVFLALLSFLADWKAIGIYYSFLVAFLLALVPTFFLTRLITYERLAARMLNSTRKTREAKLEYFTDSQRKKMIARSIKSQAGEDQGSE